jgi:hypothetical protein
MKLEVIEGGREALREDARYAAMDWICRGDEGARERLAALDATLARRADLTVRPGRDPGSDSSGHRE